MAKGMKSQVETVVRWPAYGDLVEVCLKEGRSFQKFFATANDDGIFCKESRSDLVSFFPWAGMAKAEVVRGDGSRVEFHRA